MAKDWQEFEKLIARIEQTLAPRGAVVTHNDHIVDKITGQKRQVDASIRYTIGTVPLLITIECRKRKHKQDVTWIEQLVTKKQSLGAATTIAVASSGISDEAKKLAEAWGIEFRQFSDIKQAEMVQWLEIKEIHHVIYNHSLGGYIPHLSRRPGEPGAMPHPDVSALAKKQPGDAKIFVRQSDGKAFSLGQLFDLATNNGFAITSGVPLDGTPLQRTLKIIFEKGLFTVAGTTGLLDLIDLTIEVTVRASRKVVPVSDTGFSYSGDNRSTVYGIESTTELFGDSVTLSLHKKMESNTVYISVSREKIKSKRA